MPSSVYVIELRREAGRRRDPRIPWVYVGSSARDPQIRFAQHRRGYKSSGLVKRFAWRLRPDLYEDLAPFPGSRRAQAAEVSRARELAGAGFVAHCDGTSYGKDDAAAWSEWEAERLEPVIAHLRAAAQELLDSSFEPLSRQRCGQLLHGERGFWVDEFIDSADPPPAYGLFSHVQLDALERALPGSPAASAGEPASASPREPAPPEPDDASGATWLENPEERPPKPVLNPPGWTA